MLHICYSASSQWVTVGDTGFSKSLADFPFIAINKSETPFVIYKDALNYAKATVMKFDGSNWVSVGNAGFSAGTVYCTTMAFDSEEIPYVAYMDIGGSNNKATVKKFDGNNWVTVGVDGFTPSAASYTSIAIDRNNIPYVAFRDAFYNYRASVMKFNGNNWVYVGSPGFSALGGGQQGALYTSLAIDKNGTPYVAYTEMSNNFNATVMKFDGSNWVYVGGTTGLSVGSANNTSIVIDSNGIPYVGYEDNGNGSKATVKKFNGSDWISLGTQGFSPGVAEYTFLAMDKNDNLYMAYEDYTNNKKASVMKFNGVNWVTVGTAGFSGGETVHTTIAINGNGTPYVAYSDGSTIHRSATVMKLDNNTGIKETKNNSSLIVYPNPTQGTFQINYFSNEKSKMQLNIIDARGKTVYTETFRSDYNNTVDLSKLAKGVYFIEIVAPDNKRINKRIVLD